MTERHGEVLALRLNLLKRCLLNLSLHESKRIVVTANAGLVDDVCGFKIVNDMMIHTSNTGHSGKRRSVFQS
jgi:hypothetical protein